MVLADTLFAPAAGATDETDAVGAGVVVGGAALPEEPPPPHPEASTTTKSDTMDFAFMAFPFYSPT